MTPFQAGMDFVALHEWGKRTDGGYTNNPVDPGGETKYGIAKRSHPDVDIKNLTLQGAYDIYLSEYWNQYKLDDAPYPYSICLFDSYVQHNPNVVQGWDNQAAGDRRAFLELRRSFYLRLIEKNPAEGTFKNGWLGHVNDLGKYCDILEQEDLQDQLNSSGTS